MKQQPLESNKHYSLFKWRTYKTLLRTDLLFEPRAPESNERPNASLHLRPKIMLWAWCVKSCCQNTEEGEKSSYRPRKTQVKNIINLTAAEVILEAQ